MEQADVDSKNIIVGNWRFNKAKQHTWLIKTTELFMFI